MFAQADANRIPLPDRSVDLVFGSPPYLDCRTYGIEAQRNCQEWIEWMLDITEEACRVSRGLVLWVCAGAVRNHCYQPGPEGLLYEWWKLGRMCWRPVYWYRQGIPGSGGKYWLRADVEYVLAFLGPNLFPKTNNTAMGHKPKWPQGGNLTNRCKDGSRIDRSSPVPNLANPGNLVETESFWVDNKAMGELPKQVVHKHAFTPRMQDGKVRKQMYDSPDVSNPGNLVETESFWVDNKAMGKPPKLAFHSGDYRCRTRDGKVCKQMYDAPDVSNPGNLIKTNNGYGNIGSILAHENEAPFSEKLAEFFIKTACPPEGLVLDPFSGSGTTVSVALMNGRRGIGLDIRQSQCELGFRRIADNQRPKSDLDPKQIKPLPGQLSLF